MVNSIKNKKGATLVELIMVLLIIAIIGATIAGAVIFFVELFMYSPRQMNTQKIAQELTATMIDGDSSFRGIRYTRSVLDASAIQYSYTYGYPTAANQLSVRFRWDATDKQIYRSSSTDGGASWSSEDLIPYYISPDIVIDGKDTPSTIFTYKKAADANWTSGVDALTAIRRAIISINLKTGSGSTDDFQASYDFTTSCEIKGF